MIGTARVATRAKILVVDDNRDIRELMAEALMLEGYRLQSAPNGKVALEQARATPPDLIVLDLMMPIMSGWEFLEAQRGDPKLAAIPVIVVTAVIDPHVEFAAELLRKPFDLSTLLATVARCCGNGCGAASLATMTPLHGAPDAPRFVDAENQPSAC